MLLESNSLVKKCFCLALLGFACYIGIKTLSAPSNVAYADDDKICNFNNCYGKLIRFEPGKAFAIFDRLYFYDNNSRINVYYCDKCGIVQKQ